MIDTITLVDFEPDPDGSFIVYASHMKAGYLVRPPLTKTWWFVRSDENCSPIFAEELRAVADKLDELNGVKEREDSE